MFRRKYKTYLLDGDNVRHGLNKDLGFDEKVELKIFEELVKLRSFIRIRNYSPDCFYITIQVRS